MRELDYCPGHDLTVQLAARRGLAAVPWGLIVSSVPEGVLGAFVAPASGKVSPTATGWVLLTLLLITGTLFLFAHRLRPPGAFA